MISFIEIKNISLKELPKNRLIVFLFGIGVGIFLSLQMDLGGNKNTANVSQSLQLAELHSSSPGDIKSTSCFSGKFPDNVDDWIIKQYNDLDQEGFYCPRLHSDFLSPDIWYKNSIPTKFESIEFRYKVKNVNKSNDATPSFILSFGNNPYVFRAYLPLESNPQLMGLEKIINKDSKYLLQRENPYQLKKPVRDGVETELQTRMVIGEGNNVTFLFNPTYISGIKGEEDLAIEDSIPYSFFLPNDPKPSSGLSESKVGFGTFKGSCVKPISYKFCY